MLDGSDTGDCLTHDAGVVVGSQASVRTVIAGEAGDSVTRAVRPSVSARWRASSIVAIMLRANPGAVSPRAPREYMRAASARDDADDGDHHHELDQREAGERDARRSVNSTSRTSETCREGAVAASPTC